MPIFNVEYDQKRLINRHIKMHTSYKNFETFEKDPSIELKKYLCSNTLFIKSLIQWNNFRVYSVFFFILSNPFDISYR